MRNRLTIGLVLCTNLLLIACNPAENDWNKATSANTLMAYQAFLQEHPGDKHADQARGRMLALQDDADWNTAKNLDTIGGFQDYLQKESGGVHVLEAQAQVTALKRADAWLAAQKDGSAASLQAFLKQYPQGPEADQARQKLDDMAYRVQLADTHSKAAAERRRAQLQARFGSVVHDVVVVPPTSPDTNYRVTSGPMSQATATSVCASLERAHQSCKAIQTPGMTG